MASDKPDYKISYNTSGFNRSKLTRAQEQRIAFETCKRANQHMIPNKGGINLVYDRSIDQWLSQYVIETPLGHQQVGWGGGGRTAIEALRMLEAQNQPHPLLIQQQWEQQDRDGKAHEQPNKLN